MNTKNYFINSLVLVFSLAITFSCTSEVADIVIQDAQVADGSGKEIYRADVYLKDGRITKIDTSRQNSHKAQTTIIAAGKILAPGFIDLHSHGNPITHGSFRNFLAMGVTTITLGQDGFNPGRDSVSGWIDSVNQRGSGTNIALFMGHGTLRTLAGVGETVEITPGQLSDMKNILENNLPYTFGMSTGLEYTPALFAAEEELLALAEIIGNHGRMIMSHMRNEDDDAVISSIEELVRQGRYCRVHISHLKSVYGKGAARAEEILNVLFDARSSGVEISADVYPYTASYTGIAILFPDWAKTEQQLQHAIRSRRQELETFIINKVNDRNGPEATLFGTDPWKGMTLKQVADSLRMPFQEVLIDSIGPEGASAAYFVMNRELQDRFITDSIVAVASDGSPVSYHPRGHGTFARLIETYVVQENKLSLAEAIRKVTSYPASILKIADRGFVKEGFMADLVLFDAQQVKEQAGYSDPHQLAKGFDYVIVNGRLAVDEGRFSSTLYGKVLKPL